MPRLFSHLRFFSHPGSFKVLGMLPQSPCGPRAVSIQGLGSYVAGAPIIGSHDSCRSLGKLERGTG